MHYSGIRIVAEKVQALVDKEKLKFSEWKPPQGRASPAPRDSQGERADGMSNHDKINNIGVSKL